MNHRIQFSWRPLRFAALSLILVGLTPFSTRAQFRGREASDWVSVWGASPGNVDNRYGPSANGQTIREHVRLSLGGNRIRIRLSDLLGSRDLVVGAVHVALHAGNASTLPGTDHTVTFSDQPSVTIPIGAQVVSDDIWLEVKSLDEIAVSIYVVQDGAPLTFHRDVIDGCSVSPPGDFTAAGVMPVQVTGPGLCVLSAVEVREGAAFSVVTVGDDVTNGQGIIGGVNHRWSDYLAERLHSQNATPGNTPVAVVNAGIEANRLLDTIAVFSPGEIISFFGSGPSALERFDRDAIAQAHVKWVMVFEGINDINSAHAPNPQSPPAPRTFRDVIGAYKQLIARAHGAGLKIYGCTLIPANFTGSNEQFRQDVNSWIRNSGQFDAVIDFDAAIRDPSHPNQILPAYLRFYAFGGGPNGRYPNDLGHQTMANAVDLSLFKDE
jgi:lysophospholipase L1-like esterase